MSRDSTWTSQRQHSRRDKAASMAPLWEASAVCTASLQPPPASQRVLVSVRKGLACIFIMLQSMPAFPVLKLLKVCSAFAAVNK